MKVGGLAPHIFNYLNEFLVNLFIKKRIKFLDIVKLNEKIWISFLAKIRILLIQNSMILRILIIGLIIIYILVIK